MERAVNRDALNKYIESLTEKLVFNYYNTHERISGSDVKSFTSINQINQFIVFQLFHTWNQEMENLKSPYFDYKNEEVQRSLKHFMQTLSFHISIGEEAFQPLLKKAIEDTLELIISPFNFLKETCFDFDEVIVTPEFLKEKTKFVSINKFIVERALKQFDGRQSIPTDDFINVCSEVYISEKEQQYPLENFLNAFSLHVPADILSSIIPNHEVSEPQPMIEAKELEEVTEVEEAEAPVIEKHNQTPLHAIQEPVKTLNDTFQPKETLASRLEKQKIDNILQSISLNERYTYLNILFEGNKEDFDRAFETVETLQSSSEAKSYLESSFAEQYEWGKKEEATTQLYTVLEKRF